MKLINKYGSKDIFKWRTTNVICLYVKIENNVLIHKRINNNCIERAECTLQMIKDTLNKYKINNVEIYINLMDIPINNPYFLQFSSTTNSNINTIPSFSFYGWKDVKLDDFFTIKNNMLNNIVTWDNKVNKIMWSGTTTCNFRKRMNELNKNKLYIYNLSDITNKYYELKDHTQYKYLLDIEGVGYSARFPYLALTGSCIILIENSDPDRDYKLYYDEHFIEDVHYLKIRYNKEDDISSINEKILDKINKNNCKKIGEDCKQIAINVFTKDNILLYMSNILNYYAKYYEKNDVEYNPDLISSFTYLTSSIKKRIINRFKCY